MTHRRTYHRMPSILLAALLLALLGPLLSSAPAGAAPVWTLRWSPDPSTEGLGAFETIEDDRADSHPEAGPHIKVANGAYRFDMHMIDRDTATDRQRHEVTGNRTSSSGYLQWKLGETWRVTYSMYIPSSLMATTSFTHIMQTKQPGPGTSPITVTSLRRVNGVQTIEHKVFAGDVLVGRTNLEPLQNKWIDIEYEIKIGDGTAGSVRWVVRNGTTTVVDATKTGVDTFLADRVRPKWGIYRSLGDTSGSLRDTYLLLRNMRAYQLTGGTTPAPGTEALLSQGRPASASSTEGAGFEPGLAFDGQSGTRWASAEGADPQWLRVDLGTTAALTRVRLDWEAAYASAYRIQSSTDGTTWTDRATVTGGDGGTDDITVTGNARYVRVYGTQRATPYGYSLYELKVYGTTGGSPTPARAPNPA
ncbi:discoidin domain-containing protein [Streptomyces sp. c-19]|uniref:discoidin domain-containing protein n=1 Tax=Streptomyces sp. c-19 TaxID=2789275 RepID=UPI00397F2196